MWPEPGPWSGAVALRLLTSELLALDTQAYAASPVAIAAHSLGRWPTSLTLAENAELVARHEAEHAEGSAWAYAVLDPDLGREVGCAYLRPSLPGHAVLTFWLLDDAATRPSAAVVLADLVAWLGEWPVEAALLRVHPDEAEPVAAAREVGLAERAGPAPYRWFEL
jgi:hypothetical protein